MLRDRVRRWLFRDRFTDIALDPVKMIEVVHERIDELRARQVDVACDLGRQVGQLHSQVRYLASCVGKRTDEAAALEARVAALEADAGPDRWGAEFTFGATTAEVECRGDFDYREVVEARLVSLGGNLGVGSVVERIRSAKGYGGATIVVPAGVEKGGGR